MRHHRKEKGDPNVKEVDDVEVKVIKKVKKTSPSPKAKKGGEEEKKIMYVKPRRQSKPKVKEDEVTVNTKKKVSNTRRNKSGSR